MNRNRRPLDLARRAGRIALMETLEPRVVLAGDHASIGDFMNATVLTPDANGEAVRQGTLEVAGDDDMFAFVMPDDGTPATTNFVTVLADVVTFAGSTLDSRVTVYDSGLNVIGSGSTVGPVSSGAPSTDGWFGFVAEEGQTYFIQVTSDAAAGPGATGNYRVRLDALPDVLSVDPTTGFAKQAGQIDRRNDDQIFRVDVPSAAQFKSLFGVNAVADPTVLDARLDIYDWRGSFVTGDSQAGRQTNPFVVFESGRGARFFIRVRSDEFGPISSVPSFGAFDLVADAAATQVALDQARRDAQLIQQNLGGSTDDDVQFELFSFVSERTGRARIDLRGTLGSMNAVVDPTLRLYTDDAALIGFNDDAFLPPTTAAQIIQTLQGGDTYFAVADNFNDVGITGRREIDLGFETGIVLQTAPALDDHGTGTNFANATALVWGAALQAQSVDLTGGSGPVFTPVSDHSEVTTATATGLLTPGDSDLFVFTPPVDVLGEYEGLFQDVDMDPSTPDQLVHRPASRLEIVLEPNFTNPYVQGADFPPTPIGNLFDSRGNLVAAITFDGALMQPPSLLAGSALAEAAARDGGLYGDTLGAAPNLGGIRVWGGEAYYLQVLNVGTEGRYNLRVTTDAFPDPSDPTNQNPGNREELDGTYSAVIEQPDAGELIASLQYQLNALAITGDARLSNRTAANGLFGWLTTNPGNLPIALYERGIALGAANIYANPAVGTPFHNPTSAADTDAAIVQEGGLGAIEHPLDDDLYFFTATQDGPVEVRILTTGLEDFFREQIITTELQDTDGDPATPEEFVDVFQDETVESRTYDSLLDSLLKVFDSDQTLIAQNDDSGIINGESQTQSIGNLGSFEFQRRDARVVFNAQQGVTYFIQVESAQRTAYQQYLADGTTPVSWANLIGSYDILVNGLPSDPTAIAAGDDHANLPNSTAQPFATVIQIGDDGTGTIGGRIRDVAGGAQQNPNDTDGFVFIAPTSGTYTVSIQRRSADNGGGNLQATLSVFEDSAGTPFASATANASGLASVTFNAEKGSTYAIRADGQGTSGADGTYDITVSGPALTDDHADFEDDVSGATRIALPDFLTSASAQGNLEDPGDTDVFFFEALTYDDITITVSPIDALLDPRFTVYEQQVDPSGNPVLTRVASDLDSGAGVIATRNFGVTPTRLSSLTGLTYPRYYIVVSSEDTQEGLGRYEVLIEYTSTDDHSDLTDLVVTDAAVLETPIALSPVTGQGSATGVKENVPDTDVFTFIATASGTATVEIASTDGNFRPLLRVFNRNAVELSTTFTDTGALTAAGSFQVVRGERYFFSVGNSSLAAGNQRRGTYEVSVSAPPVDDHANAGELSLATVITISSIDGDGQVGTNTPGGNNPRIDPAGDTDLFTFTPLVKGDTTITVTPFTNEGMPIQARITLLSPFGVSLQTATAGAAGQAVSLNLPGLGVRQFYILVEDVSGTRTGAYTLAIEGPAPTPDPDGGGNGGGDADEVDFSSPTIVNLDRRTGDGQRSGDIGAPGDRDLYIFTPEGAGLVQVQVVTPDGSTLDASITILQFPNESPASVIRFNDAGFPGATVVTQFFAKRNTAYYAIVDGIGTDVGDYTLRVDAQPAVSTLYLPDGMVEPGRFEQLALVNPNDFSVSYRVWLRYADGTTEVINNGAIDGQRQSLVTLSNINGSSPVGARANTPYSLEIWSNGALAASLIGYDGQADTGAEFTETLAPTWDFARVQRQPGLASDTITVFNPNAVAVDVTLTGYQNGSTVSVVRRVAALQRTAWDLNDLGTFPTGIFSARVSAAAADPAESNKFMGVIASVRHEDVAAQAGYALLGNPHVAETAGVIGSLENGAAVAGQLVVFNPGDTSVSFQFTGDYFNTALPDVTRVITIAARSQVVLTGAQIGLAANQPAGIAYSASGPVSVVAVENRLGESNAKAGQSVAASRMVLAGGSLNLAALGTQAFEWLTISNPTSVDARATVQFFFGDGTMAQFRPFIAAGDFVSIDLTTRPEITGRAGIPRFGINVFAPVQITTTLTHYDLAAGGGWTIHGRPIGLTNGVSTLT